MNALVPIHAVPPGALTVAEIDATMAYAENATAASTRRVYASDWRSWCAFAAARGAQTLPAHPGMVAAHLTALADAGLSVSSISRAMAAIAYHHKQAGMDTSPTATAGVRAVLRGIRRTVGTAPTRRKQPVTAERLAMMFAQLPNTLAGKRDRALLALGFAGALRRSELVALTVADLAEVPDGYRLTIRRSKTDQTGAGQEIAVPRGYRLRPVEAVQSWLQAAGITSGPVFRQITVRRLQGRGKPATELVGEVALDGRAVAVVVKRCCRRVGLDPTEFSGHSLRSGFVTSAVEDGASVLKVCEVTRHKSAEMVMVYSRRVDLFREHAGSGFL